MFLVFFVVCFNGTFLKPTWPMCDGRSFASPLFRSLAGRDGFLRRLLFRWVVHFALTLTRSLTMHDATFCPWRILSMNVGAHMIPCRASFCTALWLHRNQSFMLVQEAPPAKDVDLTCNKTLPTNAITCQQMGPISSEWPVAFIAKSDQQSPLSSHDNFNDELQQSALPTTSHSRWKRDALQPPQVQHDTADRDTCDHFADGGTIIPGNENAGGLATRTF